MAYPVHVRERNHYDLIPHPNLIEQAKGALAVCQQGVIEQQQNGISLIEKRVASIVLVVFSLLTVVYILLTKDLEAVEFSSRHYLALVQLTVSIAMSGLSAMYAGYLFIFKHNYRDPQVLEKRRKEVLRLDLEEFYLIDQEEIYAYQLLGKNPKNYAIYWKAISIWREFWHEGIGNEAQKKEHKIKLHNLNVDFHQAILANASS